MSDKDLDLTHYAKVIAETHKIHTQYSFTIPKRLLNNNGIAELLPYYRIGNWKTKEIFKLGKATKRITNNKIHYTKGIPKSAVNRLQIEKHDILRIRVVDDIIWIEKIDDIYNNKSMYITHLIKHNDHQTQLLIPAIICNGRTAIDIDFLRNIISSVRISKSINGINLPNKLIEKNDLTINTKLLCTIQSNKLTVEKLNT